MENLNLDNITLKRFGITMGIAFLVIAIMVVIRHRGISWPFFSIAIIFFTLAFNFPGSLKWIYIPWMKLAFVLSWINTRLILIILFYLVFSPIGLAMRLFRIDLLEKRIDKMKDSYWRKSEKKSFNPVDYERQF